MTRYKLILEYDGRPFVGFQRQANGPSVQGALEAAIAGYSGETVSVLCAGRTDAGVHARGQVAHVDLARDDAPQVVMNALNAHLRPLPVAVLAAARVSPDFHARFSAIRRHYTYRIVNRRAPLALDQGLAWQVGRPLDAGAMAQAAQILVGRHDFTTFRHVHCQATSAVKTLERLAVERLGEEIRIHAAARSFLHHQVRSMVGCLKLVGEGKWRAADLEAALHARDRAALGLNAPPQGLYFMQVDYEGGDEHGGNDDGDGDLA
ncbi:MAG: tRNA pseudouridine(38-40) synthase TruA [Pseudomonadota bacterium]